MNSPFLLRSGLLSLVAFSTPPLIFAELPQPPLLHDPDLKVELVASYPEVETPTAVAASPDGAVFFGNDPRDSRLSTKNPECTIVRHSSLGADRKKTVFADKVYSPAGMLWHDGWLYVIHDPLLTRFKDTNGDGVADVREDLVTSLGQDPHEGLNDHVVSGFTLGMDGFFYISIGDKGVYKAKGKDGSEATLLGGGILRCRTDGTGLEVYSGGTRNHLEVNLDAMDRAFTLDNTDDGNGWWTRLEYQVESGYYGYPYFYRTDLSNGLMAAGPQKPQPIPGALEVNERFLPSLTDFGGGSPTGGLCYLSDGLPEKYRGKHFFSEWGKRRLCVIDVAREGAAFRFVENEALLDEQAGGSFRPMEIYVAADGSLLISDWGYGGWKAPKALGSIWRLSWPGAKPARRLSDEEKSSVAELIGALAHPDRDQRLRAEWALVHRGESAFAPLVEVVHNVSASTIQKAHALWCLDLLGEKSQELRAKSSGIIRQVLADSNPEIRAQAIRALATRWVQSSEGEIAALLKDSDAQVRLQAAIGLGRLAAQDSAPLLAKALSDEDRWVRFVARVALVKVGGWSVIAPLLTSADSRASEQAWLTFSDVSDERAVEILAKTATSSDPVIRAKALNALGQAAYLPAEWDGHWWATQPVKNPLPPNAVVWKGTAKAITALSAGLADADASVRLAAAKALSLGVGAEVLPALRTRLTVERDAAVRRQLIESLGIQKDPEALGVFSTIALDEKADPEFRDTAISAVANIGGSEAKKVIAKLVAGQLSPSATLTVVKAAGEMKVLEAAPALLRHAQSADANLRLSAIQSLAALGAKANALEVFVSVLHDKDAKTVNAALQALGSLQDKRALPALLEFAKKNATRKELIAALANMPDPEAIPVLLGALRDNNSGTRRNAIGALKKMKAQSWPLIEERILAGQIPAEFVPEIKNAFDSGTILHWKVLGPFENVWGAVHPPETQALGNGGNPDLKAKYVNAEGQNVGWREVTGEAQEGKVNLGEIFKSQGMVCAYAYAEFESPEEANAKLYCGSDDQIALWFNGEKVHDFGASRSLNADNDEVALHFKAGINRLLVKIGNLSGSWEFAARIPGLDGNKFVVSKEPTPEVKQRAYVLALKADGSYLHPGKAAVGEKIFRDPTGPLGGICATCHAVGGQGGQIGPDLSAIAVNYKRPDLLTSLQEPSKTIALGFEQFLITTQSGDVYSGAIRQESNDALTILGADNQPHVIKKSEIKTKTPVALSLMPQGLTLGLKPEDLSDLLAFLETLKGK